MKNYILKCKNFIKKLWYTDHISFIVLCCLPKLSPLHAYHILSARFHPNIYSPSQCLLGDFGEEDMASSKKTLLRIVFFYARKPLALKWKNPTPPSIQFWVDLINKALPMFKLTYASRGCPKKSWENMGGVDYVGLWGHWCLRQIQGIISCKMELGDESSIVIKSVTAYKFRPSVWVYKLYI